MKRKRRCQEPISRRRPRRRTWRLELTWLTGRSRRARRNRFVLLAGAVLALLVAVIVSLADMAARERHWRVLAVRYAYATGLPPGLVVGVIRAESAGRASAVSRSGARGLMQLMPATAEEVARKHGIRYAGPDDLFRPDLNVRLGTLYLAWLRKLFRDDPWLYIAAYNAGPGAIERLRLRNPELSSEELIRQRAPAETRAYVPTVLRYWREESR